MKIEKKTVWKMDFPYAVTSYEVDGERRFACATETTGSGHCFSAQGEHLGTLWTEPGGTMTLCHMGGDSFLATHRFFKRFQSENAVVSAVTARTAASIVTVRTAASTAVPAPRAASISLPRKRKEAHSNASA